MVTRNGKTIKENMKHVDFQNSRKFLSARNVFDMALNIFEFYILQGYWAHHI